MPSRRLSAKGCHFVCKRLIETLVKFAVVRHGGVYYYQVFGGAEIAEDVAHQIYLADRAEIARIYRVKGDAFLFPFLGNAGYIVRKVAEGKTFKRRVVGEHRRGQHRRFHAERAYYGQRHRKGAFAHARDVLNSKYSFHIRTVLVSIYKYFLLCRFILAYIREFLSFEK